MLHTGDFQGIVIALLTAIAALVPICAAYIKAWLESHTAALSKRVEYNTKVTEATNRQVVNGYYRAPNSLTRKEDINGAVPKADGAAPTGKRTRSTIPRK